MTLSAQRLTAEKAVALWKHGAILIDVRSPTGRARNGEIAEAVVVPKAAVVDLVGNRLGQISRDVVLFCGSVAGTTPLLEALTAAGHTHVFDVEGGFSGLVATGAFDVSESLLPQ